MTIMILKGNYAIRKNVKIHAFLLNFQFKLIARSIRNVLGRSNFYACVILSFDTFCQKKNFKEKCIFDPP